MGAGLVLAALVFAAVAAYVSACRRWPYVPCGRCEGTGKRRSWWGGAFRLCRRCGGTARQVRPGRRVLNWLHVLRDDQ